MLSPYGTELTVTGKQATFSGLPTVKQTIPANLSAEGWVPALLGTKITLVLVLFVVVAVVNVTGSRLSAKLWICASHDGHLASHFSGQHSDRFRPISNPRHNILLSSVPSAK
jgi:hypothetical protein